jgi:hypothetical protein
MAPLLFPKSWMGVEQLTVGSSLSQTTSVNTLVLKIMCVKIQQIS